MSKKKKKKKKTLKPDGTKGKNQKASLDGETVEPRILLSATWIDGTAGDDIVVGTKGDDTIDILFGIHSDTSVNGGEGNDIIRSE